MLRKTKITIIVLFSISICAWAQIEKRIDRMPRGTAQLDVTTQKDIVYSTTGDVPLRMDIAYPSTIISTPRPVVVWIHGGAWRAGNKNNNQARFLTSSGYVTASINYRLSQEAIWPAQIHDCKAAIRFLRAHAEKYNIDPNRIGVWGSSAGGHLVSMLGTSGDVKELEGDGGWQDRSSRVQAVVDFFGPTNFIKMCDEPSDMNHAAANSPEAQLIGGAVRENPDRVRSADPITYVSNDDPPFLIVHGDRDMTVPYNQSELMHNALKKAGVAVEFITVKGGKHGGWNGKTVPTNREIREKVKEFFGRVLR